MKIKPPKGRSFSGRCLIIKNDGIGDLVLASGVIASIAEQFDGSVDLVTCSQNLEVAERISGVSNVIPVSRDGLRLVRRLARRGVHWERRPKVDRSAIQRIRSQDYEMVVCLRRYIRASSLILMGEVKAVQKHCCWEMVTNAPVKYAERKSRGWCRFEGIRSDLSELTHYQNFLRSVFEVEDHCPPKLDLLEPIRRVGQHELQNRIALIIGGASTNWPAASWFELVRILEERGHSLSLYGGPREGPLAKEIQRLAPTCLNRVGEVSLFEAESEISQSKLVVANDTGMAHLASLRARHVLVVMGGGTFPRFLPWPGAENQYVILNPMDCYGCGWNCDYTERHCLHLISAGSVADYGEEILARGQAAGKWRSLGSNSKVQSFNALRSFPELGRQEVRFNDVFKQ